MDVHIPCICPPRDDAERHPEGDTVVLRDKLDFRTATAIRKCIAFNESDDESGRAAEILARLSEGYLLFGIEAWTVVDDKGKPVPVGHTAIRELLLERWDAATVVSDAADELYQGAILLPLLQKASNSSPPSPIDASTSPETDSSSEPPMPSKPSLISTSPMDDTERTSLSLAGVSSYSPRSTSGPEFGPSR